MKKIFSVLVLVTLFVFFGATSTVFASFEGFSAYSLAADEDVEGGAAEELERELKALKEKKKNGEGKKTKKFFPPKKSEVTPEETPEEIESVFQKAESGRPLHTVFQHHLIGAHLSYFLYGDKLMKPNVKFGHGVHLDVSFSLTKCWQLWTQVEMGEGETHTKFVWENSKYVLGGKYASRLWALSLGLGMHFQDGGMKEIGLGIEQDTLQLVTKGEAWIPYVLPYLKWKDAGWFTEVHGMLDLSITRFNSTDPMSMKMDMSNLTISASFSLPSIGIMTAVFDKDGKRVEGMTRLSDADKKEGYYEKATLRLVGSGGLELNFGDGSQFFSPKLGFTIGGEHFSFSAYHITPFDMQHFKLDGQWKLVFQIAVHY